MAGRGDEAAAGLHRLVQLGGAQRDLTLQLEAVAVAAHQTLGQPGQQLRREDGHDQRHRERGPVGIADRGAAGLMEVVVHAGDQHREHAGRHQRPLERAGAGRMPNHQCQGPQHHDDQHRIGQLPHRIALAGQDADRARQRQRAAADLQQPAQPRRFLLNMGAHEMPQQHHGQQLEQIEQQTAERAGDRAGDAEIGLVAQRRQQGQQAEAAQGALVATHRPQQQHEQRDAAGRRIDQLHRQSLLLPGPYRPAQQQVLGPDVQHAQAGAREIARHLDLEQVDAVLPPRGWRQSHQGGADAQQMPLLSGAVAQQMAVEPDAVTRGNVLDPERQVGAGRRGCRQPDPVQPGAARRLIASSPAVRQGDRAPARLAFLAEFGLKLLLQRQRRRQRGGSRRTGEQHHHQQQERRRHGSRCGQDKPPQAGQGADGRQTQAEHGATGRGGRG